MSPSRVAGAPIIFADFRNLKVHCPYVAFMPQWDFLDFLADKARAYPHFRLMMNAKSPGWRWILTGCSACTSLPPKDRCRSGLNS